MLSFLLFTAAYTPRADASVTYTNYGARIEAILPDLSTRTGLTLRAAPEMSQRVLVLRLNEAPQGEVLSRIATATYGTWVSEAGDLVLHRNAKRYAEDVASTKAFRTAAFLHVAERLANPQSSSRDEDDVGPEDKAIGRLISPLDIAEIAGLPDDQELVFSTSPTPLQRPLPAVAMSVCNDLLANLRAQAGSSPSAKDLASYPYLDPLKTVAKADLTVSKSVNQISAGLLFFNSKGKLIYEKTADSYLKASDFRPRRAKLALVPDGEKSHILPLSDEASELIADFQTGDAPSAMLQKKLSYPLDNDPSATIGEVMAQLAKAVHRQLVAAPGDDLLRICNLDSKVSIAKACRPFYNSNTTDDGSTDGWIIVSESVLQLDPSLAEHVDRTKISKLIRSMADRTGLEILDLLHVYESGFMEMANLPQSLLYPKLFPQLKDASSFLALLAAMEDGTVKRLIAGETLMLGELPLAEQPEFETAGLVVQLDMGSEFDGLMRRKADLVFDRKASADIQQELEAILPPRTDDFWRVFSEVAESHSPPTTRVSLSIQEDPSVTCDPDPENLRGLGPLSFVLETGGIPRNTKLRYGVNRKYSLRFEYAPFVYVEAYTTLTNYDTNVTVDRVEDLPIEFRTKIKGYQVDLAAYLKQVEADRASRQTGAGPP